MGRAFRLVKAIALSARSFDHTEAASICSIPHLEANVVRSRGATRALHVHQRPLTITLASEFFPAAQIPAQMASKSAPDR